MKFATLILALLICSAVAAGVDLPSYCAGWCRSRYQDGTEIHGRCACIDYYPINPSPRIEMPKRMKTEFTEPRVYDGIDEMHFAPSDPDPRPTQDGQW